MLVRCITPPEYSAKCRRPCLSMSSLEALLAEFTKLNIDDASVDGVAAFKALQEKAQSLLKSQPPSTTTPIIAPSPTPSTFSSISAPAPISMFDTVSWPSPEPDSVVFGSVSPKSVQKFGVQLGVLTAEPLCARQPDGSMLSLDPLDWKTERKVIMKALADSNRAVRVRFETGTVDNLRVRALLIRNVVVDFSS